MQNCNFKFKINKTSNESSLRSGVISTPRGKINTPVFMPVGTVGAVKTVAPWELRGLGTEIILGNTYHLYLRPGEKLIEDFGGLAEFNRWQGPTLTDSGGYQVFSLREKKFMNQNLKFKIKEENLFKEKKSLVKISENGIEFRSYLDGSKHFFTPEKVIDIQLAIGSDIIMPLDVCPPSIALKSEVKKAVGLSIKWLCRSKEHLESRIINYKLEMKNHDSKFIIHNSTVLFGIVQGGIYADLRQYCANEMIKLNLPGYAIGGLAVGESQSEMLEIVNLLDGILPKDKPRYLMGVGTPDDIIKATKAGVDMFDCVLPTRMARHGVAYKYKFKNKNLKFKIRKEKLFEEINLRKSQYQEDKNPIDKNCQCPACKEKFSRAYLHHLVREKEILGMRLLALHNLHTYFELMREIRSLVDK